MSNKLNRESLLDGDDDHGLDDQEDWGKDSDAELRLVSSRPAKTERKGSALRAIEERRERMRLRNEMYDLHFDVDGVTELD